MYGCNFILLPARCLIRNASGRGVFCARDNNIVTPCSFSTSVSFQLTANILCLELVWFPVDFYLMSVVVISTVVCFLFINLDFCAFSFVPNFHGFSHCYLTNPLTLLDLACQIALRAEAELSI